MALSSAQLAEIQSIRHAAGGYIPAAAVQQLVASGTPIEQLLLDLIPMAKTFAVPPISNFYVGAVALGTSGNVYFGANYEFPGQALSFTIHGEQAATAHALSFEERGIATLAVSAAPCGYCRQFLNELTTATTLRVVLPDMPATPLQDLLPHAFGPRDLGIDAALMSPQSHHLTLTGEIDDLTRAALDAANASYAPYSHSYAGVALRTSDGAIHTGGIAENAAFNPSLSPLEAAIVTMSIRGGKTYADLTDAVLVETANAKASQAGAARAVLETLTSVPLRIYTAT